MVWFNVLKFNPWPFSYQSNTDCFLEILPSTSFNQFGYNANPKGPTHKGFFLFLWGLTENTDPKPRCLLPVSKTRRPMFKHTELASVCAKRTGTARHCSAKKSCTIQSFATKFTQVRNIIAIYSLQQSWLDYQISHWQTNNVSIKRAPYLPPANFVGNQASWSRNPGLVGRHQSAWTFQDLPIRVDCREDLHRKPCWGLNCPVDFFRNNQFYDPGLLWWLWSMQHGRSTELGLFRTSEDDLLIYKNFVPWWIKELAI